MPFNYHIFYSLPLFLSPLSPLECPLLCPSLSSLFPINPRGVLSLSCQHPPQVGTEGADGDTWLAGRKDPGAMMGQASGKVLSPTAPWRGGGWSRKL
jgi:hypothetical protein